MFRTGFSALIVVTWIYYASALSISRFRPVSHLALSDNWTFVGEPIIRLVHAAYFDKKLVVVGSSVDGNGNATSSLAAVTWTYSFRSNRWEAKAFNWTSTEEKNDEKLLFSMKDVLYMLIYSNGKTVGKPMAKKIYKLEYSGWKPARGNLPQQLCARNLGSLRVFATSPQSYGDPTYIGVSSSNGIDETTFDFHKLTLERFSDVPNLRLVASDEVRGDERLTFVTIRNDSVIAIIDSSNAMLRKKGVFPVQDINSESNESPTDPSYEALTDVLDGPGLQYKENILILGAATNAEGGRYERETRIKSMHIDTNRVVDLRVDFPADHMAFIDVGQNRLFAFSLTRGIMTATIVP